MFNACSADNVTLHLDGVLYYRVVDPYKVTFGPFLCRCLELLAALGILWSGGRRVFSGAVGTDHHAVGTGQDQAGFCLPGADEPQPCYCG